MTIHVFAEPVAALDDHFQVLHGRELIGNVVANDFNWDGLPLAAATVTIQVTNSAPRAFPASYRLPPGGELNVPELRLARYAADADDGLAESNPATVTIDVTNTRPQASPGGVAGAESSKPQPRTGVRALNR